MSCTQTKISQIKLFTSTQRCSYYVSKLSYLRDVVNFKPPQRLQTSIIHHYPSYSLVLPLLYQTDLFQPEIGPEVPFWNVRQKHGLMGRKIGPLRFTATFRRILPAASIHFLLPVLNGFYSVFFIRPVPRFSRMWVISIIHFVDLNSSRVAVTRISTQVT